MKTDFDTDEASEPCCFPTTLPGGSVATFPFSVTRLWPMEEMLTTRGGLPPGCPDTTATSTTEAPSARPTTPDASDSALSSADRGAVSPAEVAVSAESFTGIAEPCAGSVFFAAASLVTLSSSCAPVWTRTARELVMATVRVAMAAGGVRAGVEDTTTTGGRGVEVEDSKDEVVGGLGSGWDFPAGGAGALTIRDEPRNTAGADTGGC